MTTTRKIRSGSSNGNYFVRCRNRHRKKEQLEQQQKQQEQYTTNNHKMVNGGGGSAASTAQQEQLLSQLEPDDAAAAHYYPQTTTTPTTTPLLWSLVAAAAQSRTDCSCNNLDDTTTTTTTTNPPFTSSSSKSMHDNDDKDNGIFGSTAAAPLVMLTPSTRRHKKQLQQDKSRQQHTVVSDVSLSSNNNDNTSTLEAMVVAAFTTTPAADAADSSYETTGSNNKNNNNNESCCGGVVDPLSCIPNARYHNGNMMKRLSSYNMDKLRDRWWDLVLRSHQDKNAVTTTPHRQKEEIAGIESTTVGGQQQEGELLTMNHPQHDAKQQTHIHDDDDDEVVSSSFLPRQRETYNDPPPPICTPEKNSSPVTTLIDPRNHHEYRSTSYPLLLPKSGNNEAVRTNLNDADSHCPGDVPRTPNILLDIIQRDDSEALQLALPRLLLCVSSENNTYKQQQQLLGDNVDDDRIVSPLHLAILLDRPNMVRILVTNPKYENLARTLIWSVRNIGESLARSGLPAADDHFLTTGIPPLLLAVTLGHEECVQILLSSYGPSSLLAIRDRERNMALHYCCYSSARSSTVPSSTSSNNNMFSVVLNLLASSSTRTNNSPSFIVKLMSCRNDQEQTPLHVACQLGCVDVVDTILNHRLTSNIQLLSNLLALQDIDHQTPLLAAIAGGSTDVVMSLLMWRGNNHPTTQQQQPTTLGTPRNRILKAKRGDSVVVVAPLRTNNKTECTNSTILSATSPTPCCPLSWAVRFENIDMVLLLLEFNNPASKSSYNMTLALRCTVETCFTDGMNGNDDSKNASDSSDEQTTMLEIIRILVENGANPCVTVEDEHIRGAVLPSVVTMAVQGGKPLVLSALLDSYENYLVRERCRRRRDPTLQRQTESFFAGLECVETAERNRACRDALVTALFHSVSINVDSRVGSSGDHLTCARVLYRRGIQLGFIELRRLKISFHQHRLRPDCDEPCAAQPHYMSRPFVEPPPPPPPQNNHVDGTSWSHLFRDLPWMSTAGAICPHLIEACEAEGLPTSPPNVSIVCNDGTRYLAHSCVLLQSGKFAAAIRFAQSAAHVSDGDAASSAVMVEIDVELPGMTLQRVLRHLYLGSFSGDMSKDPITCCSEVLELLLVGEEFLCTSLVQECEIRLLSRKMVYDKCLCSFCRRIDSRHSLYHVSGPSYLVTPQTCIDVLAVTQHLVDSCSVLDYTVEVRPSLKQNMATWRRPLEALYEAALDIIVGDFGTVSQSDVFVAQFRDNAIVESDTCSHEQLLQMSLDELYRLNLADNLVLRPMWE